MGRNGITYQEVSNAINELHGKQKNPTVDNVRELLGTGSKSTITRFLREWKSNNGVATAKEGSIPTELLALIKGLWEKLREDANNHLLYYQQEADAQIAQAQQQLQKTQQQNTLLQTQVHQLEEKLQQQIESNQQLQSSITHEQNEKTKLNERLASLELRRQESYVEIERLHQLLKTMQDNLEHYQTSMQQLQQEQSLHLEKQRNEYEQKLAQLQDKLEILINEKTHYQTQYHLLNTTSEALQVEHKALHLQHTEIQQNCDSVIATNQRLQHDHENLMRQYQQQSQQLENKHRAMLEYQFRSKTNEEKIIILEDRLTKSENKIQALRHDYELITQEKANLLGQLQQLQRILTHVKNTENA